MKIKRNRNFIGGAISVGARANMLFGGLMFAGLSTVFIAVGLWMTFSSAYRSATWVPARATVLAVDGADESADSVTVKYEYTADGQRYTGSESADDGSKAKSRTLRQCKPGSGLTVYYSPRKPADSQLSVTPSAHGLAFSMFAVPFFAIGLTILWQGLTGKELIKGRRITPGSDSVPGGGKFLVLLGTCVVCAAGQGALAALLPWPGGLVSGLVLLFVAIPAVNIWLGRVIDARRKRVKASAKAAAKTPPGPPSLRAKLVFALVFTVFWCGITGVFAWFALGTLLRHQYAKAHFAATEGVIVSSKMESHTGEDTTYSAAVKYRYTVGGEQYTGDKYDFMGGSSSDGSYASKVLRENPPGRKVTVYYNPDNPAEAVLRLEPPGICYMLLLFLQPFVLVGLGMIGWCFAMPGQHRRLTRFTQSEPVAPWTIPGWGVMEEGVAGLTINSRPGSLAPLGHLVGGYGLACFVSIFVVVFLYNGFGDADPAVISKAFMTAGGVGVLAMLHKLVRGAASSVTIDRVRGRLAVHSRKRDVEAALADVTALRLREIPYPRGTTVNNERIRYMLLEAVTEGGGTVPMHAFKRAGKTDCSAIAEKTRDALAALVGVTADATVLAAEPGANAAAPSDNNAAPSNPVEAIRQIGQAIAAPRCDSYSDMA